MFFFFVDFDQKYLEFGPENFRIFLSSCETLKNEVLAVNFDFGVPYPYPICRAFNFSMVQNSKIPMGFSTFCTWVSKSGVNPGRDPFKGPQYDDDLKDL